MKKILAYLFVALLTVTITSCQQAPEETIFHQTTEESASQTPAPSADTEVGRIGVSLPTKELPRWEQDGSSMKELLEAKGYTVDLMYADNSAAVQYSQIQEMVSNECKVLIVAAIDDSAMGSAFETAKEAGVTIIAYDRLIMNTPHVDYWVSLNYTYYGIAQGEYIEKTLGLKSGKGPYYIELFAGSPRDGNAPVCYRGVMSVLERYINNGQLVVKSGEVAFDNTATDYSAENAKERMGTLIGKYYKKDKLDAIVAPSDILSLGIIQALKDAGYGSADKPYPIVTGVDCAKENIGLIMEGSQSMSVFPDTRIVAKKAVEMADAAMRGGEVAVNDTYRNGVKDVPAFWCEPFVVTADNIREILIGGGYYTEAEFSKLIE